MAQIQDSCTYNNSLGYPHFLPQALASLGLPCLTWASLPPWALCLYWDHRSFPCSSQSRPQTTRYWTCAQESQHQCSTHWAIGQHPRKASIWEHMTLSVFQNMSSSALIVIQRVESDKSNCLHLMIFDQIHAIYWRLFAVCYCKYVPKSGFLDKVSQDSVKSWDQPDKGVHFLG